MATKRQEEVGTEQSKGNPAKASKYQVKKTFPRQKLLCRLKLYTLFWGSRCGFPVQFLSRAYVEEGLLSVSFLSQWQLPERSRLEAAFLAATSQDPFGPLALGLWSGSISRQEAYRGAGCSHHDGHKSRGTGGAWLPLFSLGPSNYDILQPCWPHLYMFLLSPNSIFDILVLGIHCRSKL